MTKLLRERGGSGKARRWRVDPHLPKRKRKRDVFGRLRRRGWRGRETPVSGCDGSRRRKMFLEMTPGVIRSEMRPWPVRPLEPGLEEFQSVVGTEVGLQRGEERVGDTG